MLFEALVGLTDERPVEPPGTDSRLVARDQQYGVAPGVQGEGQPPCAWGR